MSLAGAMKLGSWQYKSPRFCLCDLGQEHGYAMCCLSIAPLAIRILCFNGCTRIYVSGIFVFTCLRVVLCAALKSAVTILLMYLLSCFLMTVQRVSAEPEGGFYQCVSCPFPFTMSCAAAVQVRLPSWLSFWSTLDSYAVA